MDNHYYFDNNATTRVSLAVSKAMTEVAYYDYGNASSSYSLGLRAKDRIKDAREKVASLFSGEIDNIVFTSGATEANNTIIHSALKKHPERRVILTSSVEHPSVSNVLRHYEEDGYKVIHIPVTEKGVDFNFYLNHLSHDVALITFMSVNNETGMVFPIDDMFHYAKEFDEGIICHSDCVQAIGKTNIPLAYADYLSISAHKFHGPKGIGCIFKKKGMDFYPLLYGGGQERGYRSGTENVAGIVGMGVAASEISQSLQATSFLERMQHDLEESLLKEGAYIVGRTANRVSGVINVGFKGIEAYMLHLHLNKKRIFVSTGSACSSNRIGISPIIREMGVPKEYASTIRISMSRYTTKEEVDYLKTSIIEIIKSYRRKQF